MNKLYEIFKNRTTTIIFIVVVCFISPHECFTQDTLNNNSNYLYVSKNEIGFGINYIDRNELSIEYRRLIKEKEDSILLSSNYYERKTFMVRFASTFPLARGTAFLGQTELLGFTDSLAIFRYSGTHYLERMLHFGRENSYYLLHSRNALSGFNTFFNYFGVLAYQKRTDQYIQVEKQPEEEMGPYIFDNSSVLNGNYETNYLLAGLGFKLGLNMALHFDNGKSIPTHRVSLNSVLIGAYFGMTLSGGYKITEKNIIDEHDIFTTRNDFTLLATGHLGIRVSMIF